MKKYLDTAVTETVVIQRGKTDTFVLRKQESFPEISTEIPEDFYIAISGNEVIKGIEIGLRKMITRKLEYKHKGEGFNSPLTAKGQNRI